MSSRVCPKDELNCQPSGFGIILSDDLVKRCLTMDLGLMPYERRGKLCTSIQRKTVGVLIEFAFEILIHVGRCCYLYTNPPKVL